MCDPLDNLVMEIIYILCRQINMDYSLCKALSYNMEDIPVALVMYDIMCQLSECELSRGP